MSIDINSTFRHDRLALPASGRSRKSACKKLLTVFGTRPEVIKLAPVIQQLETFGDAFETINVSSGQHTDLLEPFVNLFDLRIDYNLRVMKHDQTPNGVCARVLVALDPILSAEKPDMVLVQGDTTTAMAGALAAFHRGIPVGHVEAGLRSGNLLSPYPEEMNRRLITRLATYHFAATAHNRDTLLAEEINPANIFLTGNPVVDSLQTMLLNASHSSAVADLLAATEGLKRLVLTTHRRESFGEVMTENLMVVRRFIETHEDVALIFPVHPNPNVVETAVRHLSGHARIHLIEPLSYQEFVALLSHAWLIVSDSGGVQEEAPTLRKPLLVMRENTERPEALASGVARLVGGQPERLAAMLAEAYCQGSWVDEIGMIENPFGRGDSGQRIAATIAALLSVEVAQEDLDAV